MNVLLVLGCLFVLLGVTGSTFIFAHHNVPIVPTLVLYGIGLALLVGYFIVAGV